MAPLKDKLKVLTLNAHSLLEWDAAFCLDSLTDAIIRENVDVVVLQEVNHRCSDPVGQLRAGSGAAAEAEGLLLLLDVGLRPSRLPSSGRGRGGAQPPARAGGG